MPATTKAAASSIRKVVDHMNVHLKAMQSLGSDNDILNAIIIHVVKGKLDQQSKSKWEESLNVDKLPTWDNFSDFLQKRCQVIEGNEVREHTKAHATSSARASSKTSLAISKHSCAKCNQNDHMIHKCSAFLNLPVMDRFKEVKQLNLCINCLNKGHSVKSCLSSKCRVCSLPHHSLLYCYNTAVKSSSSASFSNQSASSNANQTPTALNQMELSPTPTSLHASVAQSYADQVILATAIVNVKNKMGQFIPVRVLLDSASQLNLMTQSLAKKWQLSCKGIQGHISGISDTNSTVAYSINATIKSRINEFQAHLELWIIPTITSAQPEARIDISDWNIPRNVSLADPGFNIPHKVDMLLGADVFYQLLSVGHIRLGENLPMLQKTLFGWIVAGRFKAANPCRRICNIAVDKEVELGDNKLMELVEKFWEIEHINDKVVDWSKEQRECEKCFVNTVKRNESGRFIVQLPFKKDPSLLGDSHAIALKHFARLERRLERDPNLKNQYIEFMKEYEQLDHMQQWIGDTSKIKYFIPHHCVLKPDSSSTKLSVVFNASCPTTSGISLNDLLMVGPTVQEDLFNISIRFRCRKYAITADISKMYRQILIDTPDRQFLGILWRPSSTLPLKVYVLTTVTYGTSSAPYQATRCLVELANEIAITLPIGSHAIRKDMYVDDLLSGADTLEELIELKHQIGHILNSGENEKMVFELHCIYGSYSG